jgi:hypothetical protein
MSQDVQIITAFLGGFTAVVLKPVIQRWLQQRSETKSLIEELKDIRRHLSENIKVIENIKFNNFIPLDMHIQKFKIPDTATVFSSEIFHIFHHKHSSRLFDVRLKLRNLNIEFDQLIVLIDDERNKEVLFDLFEYSMSKMYFVIEALDRDINYFSKTLKEERISINPSKIIEKKYWKSQAEPSKNRILEAGMATDLRQIEDDSEIKSSDERREPVDHEKPTGSLS